MPSGGMIKLRPQFALKSGGKVHAMSSPQPETRPSPDRLSDPPPAAIGRYQILGRLGAGGMGTVYKSRDPMLDRVVALKVPHFDGTGEARERAGQRFQREARAAARIWHPHVC